MHFNVIAKLTITGNKLSINFDPSFVATRNYLKDLNSVLIFL